MDVDVDVDTDMDMDIHTDVDIDRLDFIYLEREMNSFSTGGGCLNVDMNTHGPHKYL